MNTLIIKKTFSIVIFAIVGTNYKFIYVNVQYQRHISDCDVFENTGVFKLLEESLLDRYVYITKNRKT